MEHLESNGLLGYHQRAFRSGYGTGTYLANLGSILDDAMKAQERVEIVSLDLAKANNRARSPGILKQLVDWGVSGNLLKFIQNFLTNRTFEVLIGNHRSKVMKEETGVPQGSVISVTLFLVAMSGVTLVLPKGVYI
ncbi:uncharacterized protein LOC134284521 [Aedes albopictus]|uniref:Reverse transcriptase domain-containing protein n=1 Tax=Aedes albopictus TaxID=7160 RepID=A0ABM1Z988_AEDAL